MAYEAMFAIDGGLDVDDLELDAPHATAHEEEVSLADRAELVGEVGLR
jgi:hypothetical protein